MEDTAHVKRPTESARLPAPLNWTQVEALRPLLRRLRAEGPSAELLAACAEAIRELAGAAIVRIAGRDPIIAFQVSAPQRSNGIDWLERLEERAPGWERRRLTWLIGTDAASALEAADTTRLAVVPLEDERLQRSALMIAWNEASPQSEDMVAALGLCADQVACSLGVFALKRQTDEAARAQFTSFLSHELRTPLTPMMMLLQSLDRKMRTGRADPDIVARLRRQTLRISRMIGDMSDLAKLQGSRLELDRAPVDLSELIVEVTDSFRPTMHRHRLELSGIGGSQMMQIDRIRIERLLLNLLEQTERLVLAGGTLRLELERADGNVRLVFRAIPDPGAEPSTGAKLELVRPDGTLNQLRGLNLGLYLAETIAAMHGGSLRIEQPEGALPELVVTLPTMAGAQQ